MEGLSENEREDEKKIYFHETSREMEGLSENEMQDEKKIYFHVTARDDDTECVKTLLSTSSVLDRLPGRQ
jgi:hypothetical protein